MLKQVQHDGRKGAVRITRHAISPRLAIRILENMRALYPGEGRGPAQPSEIWIPAYAGKQSLSFGRLVERRAVVAEQAQHFVGGVGEVGAGAEDRLHARGAEHRIILRRDDSAGDHLDVGSP